MPTAQEIAEQQRLLAQHRQNVQTLLEQIASPGGELHAPLDLINTLVAARQEITARKTTLRSWGVLVADLPDDGLSSPEPEARPGAPDLRRGNFITGGTFYGQVIGSQTNHGGPVPAPAPAVAPARQADVLLVTVTEGETRAVFAAFQARTGHPPKPVYSGDKTFYDLGHISGAHTWLVRSEAGSLTVGGAFSTISTAIDALHPAAILLVGIAFGTRPAGQQLGDILVAGQLVSYEPQRLGTDPAGVVRVIPRGDRVTVSGKVLDRCRDAELTWPANQARVRFGLMPSGQKLLDHAPAVTALLAQEPEAIGGEMEGAGLYVAATQRGVAWGVIKAICDWADGCKGEGDEEQRQALAARNAAAFALHVLVGGGFAPEAWRG